jgi:hypothetical protein
MALEFPSNPTNGQLFDDYFYDASIGAWRGIGSPNNLGVQVGQLRTASPITVANQAARDALYPAPVEGNSVFRDDLGLTQTYYAAFNASTNPGGRDVAGWYDTEKSVGLVPVRPTTVTISSGSGSANGLGQVEFSGATNLTIDGIFSSEFRNYKVLMNFNANADIRLRYVSSGTVQSGANYDYNDFWFNFGAVSNNAVNETSAVIFSSAVALLINTLSLEILDPFTATRRTSGHGNGGIGRNFHLMSNLFGVATTVTGIYLFPASGTMTGTIQVFGYND